MGKSREKHCAKTRVNLIFCTSLLNEIKVCIKGGLPSPSHSFVGKVLHTHSLKLLVVLSASSHLCFDYNFFSPQASQQVATHLIIIMSVSK